MPSIGITLLQAWHRLLSLPRHPASFYPARLSEELIEQSEAVTVLEKLSETSDVFFAISRARYDGVPLEPLPAFTGYNMLVYGYMIAKYTSRWGFYRTVTWASGGDWRKVKEVVNPGKDKKVREVAGRIGVEEEKFGKIARRVRRVWPLFP
ncbi:MAG: hypothetical protein HETSPECPRED_005391 [Heterodermia speciosa]|uniref:Uncharacterized protein n=1 Tax=Heterodermia speciosa TaxID=116794 RepID=A0A8H3IJY8_9LECA|nr:MAG: hypothetical protein HETSPECPRED_005391 [Heterodermia speciosa]